VNTAGALIRRFFAVFFLLASASIASSGPAFANDETYPKYKPSSRSPVALDIRTNAYGASGGAPNALGIGEQQEDFSAPKSGGGLVSLRNARKLGPVVLIFYRGHW